MHRSSSHRADYRGRYDADHRYDVGYRGRPRYDGPRRYGLDFGRYGTPLPGHAGYPSARWGWGPIGWASWGPGMEFWPYADVPGYGAGAPRRPPRQRPERSPNYGRRADRSLRRWARDRGYDPGYRIQPRRGRG